MAIRGIVRDRLTADVLLDVVVVEIVDCHVLFFQAITSEVAISALMIKLRYKRYVLSEPIE